MMNVQVKLVIVQVAYWDYQSHMALLHHDRVLHSQSFCSKCAVSGESVGKL